MDLPASKAVVEVHHLHLQVAVVAAEAATTMSLSQQLVTALLNIPMAASQATPVDFKFYCCEK